MSEPYRRALRSPRRRLLLSIAARTFSVLVLGLTLSAPTLTLSERAEAADAELSPPLDERSRPVRIMIPTLGIDLPVVSSERSVRGNPPGYPLCDVAQYWTDHDLPGAPGTTWIYAHAQPGMFLPLFEVAEDTAGSGLLGKDVSLQLRDDRLLRYRISDVKQHARGLGASFTRNGKRHQLVLQTSEGPPGTATRLLVSSSLVEAGWADEAAPRPQPRACSSPARGQGAVGRTDQGRPAVETDEGPALSPDSPDGPLSLALGAGAVLLGAGLLAYALVRRTA